MKPEVRRLPVHRHLKLVVDRAVAERAALRIGRIVDDDQRKAGILRTIGAGRRHAHAAAQRTAASLNGVAIDERHAQLVDMQMLLTTTRNTIVASCNCTLITTVLDSCTKNQHVAFCGRKFSLALLNIIHRKPYLENKIHVHQKSNDHQNHHYLNELVIES
jgi:hypothetical protein